MKFSTIAVPALMGFASAQDITFEEKREAEPIGPGALALVGGAAYPVANWILQKVAGPGKQAKRSIELNDDDIQFLQGLQSLQARDAAVGPGALALIGGAAYPVANWILQKVAGPGKQAKRDLTAADIDELNTLFKFNPSSEKRDLSAADIDELNTLFARDAALGPVGLAVGGSAFGAGVNWVLQRISPSSEKRDLTAADIDELNSILARDLTDAELNTIFARDAAIGPVGLAIGGSAFGAGVNWLMQRISPSSKRSIGEFAPMVRRDNLVFKPVQFAA